MSMRVRETVNSIFSGCSGGICVAIDVHKEKSTGITKNVPQEQSIESSILVAVDASRADSIADHALRWAVRNVVQEGDVLTVLGISKRIREQQVINLECTSRSWHCRGEEMVGRPPNEHRIRDSCDSIVRSLCNVSKVNFRVKVIEKTKGIVAAEASKLGASWVVIDRNLQKEGKCCMQSCSSNVVLVSQSGFRILCLNLKKQHVNNRNTQEPCLLGLPSKKRVLFSDNFEPANENEEQLSSPDAGTPFTVTEHGSSSSSCSSEQDSNIPTSKFVNCATKSCLDERIITQTKSNVEDYVRSIKDEHTGYETKNSNRPKNLHAIQESSLERTSSVRKAVSLSSKRPTAGSPPLCSICQHASPVFGRPPRRFSFSELEFATGGFCKANFLAEGGYGSVHRGVLGDGIPVAVKQYKLASSQGDMEFCSEVEVLSCAQHRNVVMLIGYCIERNRRLLVYEYICNGSLDNHISGGKKPVLKWSSRQKIAVGAARGLRYLHEECRVGCIVHRDMRPNNILLTHDFEPMVGDFGLARWQPDGDLGVETRVIGTFGYLAPEYAQTGQITEKADVYSFGVVLLELFTGRKAIDISRPRGQQCLTEWARPLLEEQAHQELMDPKIAGEINQYEVFCMLYAASLCIQRDAHLRPRMSQVLRMLEGDLNISRNSSPMKSSSGRLTYSPRSSTPSSRSSSLTPSLVPSLRVNDRRYEHDAIVSNYMSAHPIVVCNTKLSHEALKAAYIDKLESQRNSYEAS